MTQREADDAWLAYAYAVLNTKSGCECDRNGICWPGYIGANYARGRLLLVGAIHNAPVLQESGLHAMLAKAARVWAAGVRSAEADAQYLAVVRHAYVHAISKWLQWTNADGRLVRGAVWQKFQTIVAEFGLDFDSIAFTNLAKCALPSKTSPRFEAQRIASHERVWPIARLITSLRPHSVVVAKSSKLVNPLVAIPTLETCLVRRCSNRTFQSDGVRFREWLSIDSERHRLLLTKRRYRNAHAI